MVVERFVDPLAQVVVTSTGSGQVSAQSYGGIPISSGMASSISAAQAAAAASGTMSIQESYATPGGAKLLDYQVSQAQQQANPFALVSVPGSPTAATQIIPTAAKALGIAGGIYGILELLGLGQGEGLFGLDILGGNGGNGAGAPTSPVPLQGPGLAEPPPEAIIKEWHVNYDWGTLQYYLVRTGTNRRYIMLYNTKTGKWKYWPWRTPRLAVIGKNMPSHKMVTRLRKNLSKHRADADTILKMTSPAYQAFKQRKRRRRR